MQKIKNIYYSIILLGILGPTSFVFGFGADTGVVNQPISVSVKIDNPINVDSIPDFITAILGAIVAIGAPIAVLFLIYAGFLFVTARGNDTKLTEAKQFLTWTIVGIVILLGAQLLSEIVRGTIQQLGKGIL